MNSPLVAASKALTLVPFLLLLYFFDIPQAVAELTNPATSSIFVSAVILAILWTGLRRHSLSASLGISRGSFFGGAILLSLAVAVYVYGSYTGVSAWLHYESMLLFASGYVAMRVGMRLLRSLSPAICMAGLGFIPPHVIPEAAQVPVAAVVGAVLLLPFLVVMRVWAGTSIPAAVALLGVFSVLVPVVSVGQTAVATVFAVPAPLVALAVARDGQRWFTGKTQVYVCGAHLEDSSGFCRVCGKWVSRGVDKDKFEGWGLLAVGFVTALVLFSSVPVLAYQGGSLVDGSYTTRGFTSVQIPGVPAGWQVNSSTTYTAVPGQLYGVRRVYVPLLNPASERYTLYYVVAGTSIVSAAPQGDIKGWSTVLNQPMQLGPLEGYFTSYQQPGKVMLVYQGHASVEVLIKQSFATYTVTVGYVREFNDTGVSADTAAFLSDLNATWLPLLNRDFFSSSWSAFLGYAPPILTTLVPFTEAVVSLSAIGWVAYLASKRDEGLARLASASGRADGDSYDVLRRLYDSPGHLSTEHDLESGALGPGTPLRLNATLDRLEESGMIERAVADRNGVPIGVWKVRA